MTAKEVLSKNDSNPWEPWYSEPSVLISMEEYANQSKWISVNDRLPEFGKRVLVFCRIYGRYIGSYEEIGFGHGDWHDGKNLGVLPPTHWQPLPEPPTTQP